LPLVRCTGSSAQSFIHKADGSFVNQANGGCIDLWDSGEGPQVGVYTCDQLPNQHWAVNGKSIQSDDGNSKCFSTSAPTQVWVYSNAYSVELFVNGVSQGRKPVPFLGNVVWNVVWAPGVIEVRAYDKSNNQINMQQISTTTEPAAIQLEVEVGAEGIAADRQDVALIKCTIVDKSGRIIPDASNFITFTTSGPGAVIGVGNGDPSCHEPDKASTRSAFNGYARAVVQSTSQAGTVVVTASSPGLTSASVSFTTKAQ